MTQGLTSQVLMRLLDDCGLELQTKPGHLTGPAVQSLVERLNALPPQEDSEE